MAQFVGLDTDKRMDNAFKSRVLEAQDNDLSQALHATQELWFVVSTLKLHKFPFENLEYEQLRQHIAWTFETFRNIDLRSREALEALRSSLVAEDVVS